jgi:hypothetical protein
MEDALEDQIGSGIGMATPLSEPIAYVDDRPTQGQLDRYFQGQL